MSEDTLRVLVVDDDVMARMTAVQCVKKQGHRAEAADGGREALERLRSGHFDLILLDLMMPGLDGYQVLHEMKEDATLREIPVIVVSGEEEQDSVARCMAMGASGHLGKPLDPSALAAQVQALKRLDN